MQKKIIDSDGKCLNMVFLIDFRLDQKYADPTTQLHVPFSEDNMIGTECDASINEEMGLEHSCRSSLQAFGHVRMFFHRGQFPWQPFKTSTTEEKHSKQGFQAVCSTYLNYHCRALRLEDRPRYCRFQERLEQFMTREGLTCDGFLDWTQLWQAEGNALVGEIREGDECSRASHDTEGPKHHSLSTFHRCLAWMFSCRAKHRCLDTNSDSV